MGEEMVREKKTEHNFVIFERFISHPVHQGANWYMQAGNGFRFDHSGFDIVWCHNAKAGLDYSRIIYGQN